MKVLILDQQTQLYLTQEGRWTGRVDEAKDFAFTAHARAVARNLNLDNFQVIFFFPDIDYRIVVCESENRAFK